MSEDHFRKLENAYHQANCNQYYAPKLTVSEGSAQIIIPVDPKLFHAAHAVHGSAYFKAMDDAAFFAANSLVPDVFVLTTSFHIHLMRPIAEGEITGKGKVIQNTKNLIVAEAIIYNSHGKEIGRGSGNFIRSKISLGPDIGYK